MNATMNAIETTTCPCLYCHHAIEFDPAESGSTTECPHCGKETDLYIPGPAPAPPPRPTPDAPRSTLHARPSRLRPCPDCARPLSPTARACPGCGYVTDKTPSRLGTLFLIIFVLAGLYAISRAMNL